MRRRFVINQEARKVTDAHEHLAFVTLQTFSPNYSWRGFETWTFATWAEAVQFVKDEEKKRGP